MAHSRPRIGLTLDAEPPGGYSKYPWYALRANYMAAVAEAGGLPLGAPHHPELTESLLDALDGLIVTGGAFDVDPALHGAAPHPSVTLKPRRTEAELLLLRGALARDMPILGICGGAQLLAVALGGRLISHIPEERPEAGPHEQENPAHEPSHAVRLEAGSLLARLAGRLEMRVNSSHHQAVREPGPHLRVNARAPDGIVEGVEHPGRRFCLGVQWHPEFLADPGDGAILRGFVEACA